ncbi:MAG: murein biosynthesis integral membrane protein MurJ [Alphaproteobacteria bacterium]|nr:murein biosynthesis integral membrane protein MurJ [Alphaproteobacteria bacterium]
MALLRSVATVGGYTMMSRVLGFVRDILMAQFLGAGPVADAFFVALRLPNLFRSLFAEGAFSAAFVPIFAGMVAKDGRQPARLFAEDALAALTTVLFVFVLVCEIATPALLHVLAPGFAVEPEKFAIAVTFTRITFPYLLFISLVALQGGVLNSLERFAATAVAPVLLNIFLIGTLLLVRPVNGVALSWAVTSAGFAQFVWLMASCHRAGLPLRFPRPRWTPALKRLVGLMGPGIVGAGVMQLNLVVSTAVASLLPTGAVSYLYYADRLNQLPLAVVGTAVGIAILPPLSRQVRTGDLAGAVATQNRGLELALLLTVPAAVALGLLAQPLLAALFERGAFRPHEVTATAGALAAYAAGLPAFVLVKVLAPAFFARHDTATPVKIAVVAVAANFALTLILGVALPFAQVGIACATSAAGWINALLLLWLLHRRAHFRLDARSKSRIPRILAAALLMGAVLVGLGIPLAPFFGKALVFRLAALAALIAAGLTAFAGFALALGAAEWNELGGRLGLDVAARRQR